MFTVSEIAKKFRVSLASAYALVESGQLSCYRIGMGRGTIRVSEEQLREYLKSAEQEINEEIILPSAKDRIRPRRRGRDFVFLPPPSRTAPVSPAVLLRRPKDESSVAE